MKKRKIQIVGFLIGMLLLTACNGTEQKAPNQKSQETVTEAAKTQTETKAEEEIPKAKEQEIKTENAMPEVQLQQSKVQETERETGETPEATKATSEAAEIMEETLGNPRSSYGLGSAPFLKGDNILVSMFVETPESSWSEEQKQEILTRIGVATDYIEAQAAGYGIEAQLIYDYEEYPALYAEAVTDFYINEETDFLDRLDEEIALWFEEKIDYEALLSQFDAQGIATMVFVNNPGISYAIVYDGTDNVKESLVLFSGDYYNGGKSEKPITYAHEILHIFGAHDLYEEAEFTAEVTAYVEETYPKEIMLTVTGSGNTGRVIDADLSPITAYHLGWLDETEEINLFPQLIRE